MKKILQTLLIFFTTTTSGWAQCPSAAFTSSASCDFSPINITNNTTGAVSYEWDFCAGELTTSTASISDAASLTGIGIGGYNSVETINDGGNWYMFITKNGNPGQLIRLDFGNSLTNTPVVNGLGTITGMINPYGLRMIKEGPNWYALVGCNSNLGRLSFGTSITNTPTFSSLGNFSNALVGLRDLRVVSENGNLIAMAVSRTNKTISLVNFGNSVTNTPAVTDIITFSNFSGSNTGLWGADLIRDCDKWYALVVSDVNGMLYRVDFGSVLYDTNLNAVDILLSNQSLYGNASGLELERENGEFKCFFVCNAQSGKVYYFNFGNAMQNTPTVASIATGGTPVSGINITGEQSKWFGYYLLPSVPTVKQITFTDVCSASSATSDAATPAPLTYFSQGNFSISLNAYDAAGNVSMTASPAVLSNKPSVNFSITGVCELSATAFADLSVPGSGTMANWNWNFDDGNNSSVQHPLHIYTAPGTYNVKLVAANSAGCADSATQPVLIYETPVADFTATANCETDPVAFTDNSSSNLLPVNFWSWSFGDGQTSLLQNPNSTYADGGTYPAILIVKNTQNCADTISKNVTVNYNPVANASVNNDCAGQSSQFTDSSTMAPPATIISRFWNFGDAGTSTQVNPAHTYGGSGTYNVSLLCLADNGCSNTYNFTVNIVNPPSSANFSNSIACDNSPVQFTDQSVANGNAVVAHTWNFGDGGTDNIASPVHIYATTGNFSVTHCAYSGISCNTCTTKTVQVFAAPTAQFTSDVVCAQSPTQFTNQSSAFANQWSWNFDDGTNSAMQNPAHPFAIGGTYSVTLTATTANLCSASVTNTVLVKNIPDVDFSAVGECGSTSVSFTDESTIASPNTITSWLWDFGNGGAQSAQQNVVYDFQNNNAHTVSLTATSDEGCVATVSQITGAMNTSFIAPSDICVANSFDIANLSTGFSNYYWDFCSGELGLSNTNISAGPSLTPFGINLFAAIETVFDGVQWHTFILRSASASQIQLVRADYTNGLTNPPTLISLGGFTGVGSPQGIVVLKEGNNWYALLTCNAGLARINFGSSITNNAPSVYVYSFASGIFSSPRQLAYAYENGNLIVAVANRNQQNMLLVNFGNSILNNPSATDVVTGADFSGFGSSVSGLSLIRDCETWFAVVASENNGKIFRVNLGNVLFDNTVNGVDVLLDDQVIYNNIKNISVIFEGSEYKVFFVTGVSNGKMYCLNFGNSIFNPLVSAVNISIGSAIILIPFEFVNENSRWYCHFPVGNSGNPYLATLEIIDNCAAIPATSLDPNPAGIEYLRSGNQRISLIATDDEGKTIGSSRNIFVNPGPITDFSFENICIGQTTFFNNLTQITGTALQSFSWDFADGNIDSINLNPAHLYITTGNYSVTLIESAISGCADTVTKDVFITENPVADFNYTVGCQRDSAVFLDASTFTFDPIVSWNWNFAGIDSSNLPNSVQYLDTFGNADVSLVVINSRGCSDTHSETIYFDPKPDYDIEVRNTCVCDTVQFINSTTVALGDFIVKRKWDLGDGTFSTLASPKHKYSCVVSDFVAVVFDTLNNGCTDSFIIPVHIATIPKPDFTFPTICQNNPMSFIDNSMGNSDSIERWHWNFGTGNVQDTSNNTNASFSYPNTGNFNVTLTVISPTYCDSSVTKLITVLPSPVVNITADTVCYGVSTTFTNQTTIASPFIIADWSWAFGDNLIDNSPFPSHFYQTSGEFETILVATTDAGCYTADTAIAIVYPKPGADFRPQAVSCAKTTTLYDNLSTIDISYFPDSLISHLWNFDDNTPTDTDKNPTHSFAAPGDYLVSLITVSNHQCSDTVSKLVEVFAELAADFTYKGTCLGDATQFIDATPSFSVIGWQWDFGDQSFPAFTDSALHTFADTATYTVTLQVQNAIGCTDTASKSISVIQKPDARFGNLIACEGKYYSPLDSSLSLSEPITNWKWTINGSIYNEQTPSYYFADTGSFAVKLIVTSPSGCNDSVTKTVNVKTNPTAGFSVNPLYGEAPVDIHFTDLSTSATSYYWDFDDGENDVLKNPVHTYTTNDTFDITQIVYSPFGCSDTAYKTFIVIPTTLDVYVHDVDVSTVGQNDGTVLVYITALLSNTGTRIITDVQLYATLGTGGEISETWSGLLYSGGTIKDTFAAQFVLAASSSNTYVCVNAVSANHGEPEVRIDNNSDCASLTGTLQVIGPSPNPSSYVSRAGIIIPKAGDVTIDVTNALGQVIIKSEVIHMEAGRTDYYLPVERMLSDEYFINVQYNNETITRKFLIRR